MRLLLFSHRDRCLPFSRLASPSRPVSPACPPPWRPHLQARVHLQEEELALRVGQELHRPGRVVAHRLAQRHRLLPHGAPHLGRDQRGGRLLNHLAGSDWGSFTARAGQMTRGWEGQVVQKLCQSAAERTSLGPPGRPLAKVPTCAAHLLVAPLDGALAFREVDNVAVLVAQHLKGWVGNGWGAAKQEKEQAHHDGSGRSPCRAKKAHCGVIIAGAQPLSLYPELPATSAA